ncbi:hypothetical protein [Demequina lutea]|uniref:Uncharacterized protein n=1 Tax=Demequina lutea TaxID=431489 RepID=A0A7Z0CJA2_9MICO|nr:hypothetical protein [Demequina lutea]NYI42794.1 hypothetical protein [Demequina lutea]
MDDSLHSVMNDLVAADAARMSGPRFANRHGGGIARRVHTRRTVRAVGVGGASAVAVGVLAVGATHMPWGELSVASSGSDSTAGSEPATSPFQCGFVFPSASQSVEGMAIEDTGWLTSEEVLARLDRRLNSNVDSSGNPVQSEHVPVPFHVDSTQSLPTFSLVDPAGSAVAGGYMGAEDPVLHSPTIDGLQGPAGADIEVSTEGLTFVAVSQSTVIGTITSPWQPEDASPVMWTNTSLPASLTLINPEGAFSACPGATLGNNFDVYAVAGRITMDSAHVTTGPIYVWSEIAKP